VVDGRHDGSPVRNLTKELAVMRGHDDDKGHQESSEEEDVETESPASSLSDSDDGEEDREDDLVKKAPNAAEKSRELLVVDLDDEDAIAIRLLDLAIQAALRIQYEWFFRILVRLF
jgi:hypothetical protein